MRDRIVIKQGDSWSVTAGDQPVTVYFNNNVFATVNAGATTTFGPYTTSHSLRTESESAYTYAMVNVGFTANTPVKAVSTAAANVVNATDAATNLTQFNALLASLRTAGILV